MIRAVFHILFYSLQVLCRTPCIRSLIMPEKTLDSSARYPFIYIGVTSELSGLMDVLRGPGAKR